VSTSDCATNLLLEEGGSLGTVCIYQGIEVSSRESSGALRWAVVDGVVAERTLASASTAG
jgi:hypothetical protein